MRDTDRMGAQRIYETLREQILGGVFGMSGQLPSSRSLAQELMVSRTTVTNAIEQLRAEGFIEVRQGSRPFVVAAALERHGNAPMIRSDGVMRLSAFGRRLASLGPWSDPEDPQLIADFRHGDISTSDFPAAAWKRAINLALERRPTRLAYDDPRGARRLRMALQGYVWRARMIRCELEQIIIVNGSQQGLDMCARLLLEPGDHFAIEDPCYAMARQTFASAGGVEVPIPVDASGLQTDALDGVKAQLAYVTPSHQFPLGGVLSVARRRNLLGWAQSNDAYVIEDDYDSEFRYDINPVPPLHSLDEDGKVIYLGTVSKTLSPTLRLGYLIVPTALQQSFAAAKMLMDRHSASLEQEALATLIESGAYERHVRRVRRLNHERRETLLNALRHGFGDRIEVDGADAGLHVTVWFRQIAWTQEANLVERAYRVGVGIHPISPMYGNTSNAPDCVGLVMGYSGLDPKRIERGVHALAKVVQEH